MNCLNSAASLLAAGAKEFRKEWKKNAEEGAVAAELFGRIDVEENPSWDTPTMEERNLCDNCDGAPDGGHVSDAYCIYTLES